MRSTFVDETLEHRFGLDGYVHIPGYFTEGEVALSREIYDDLHQGSSPGRGFASDLDWADLELKASLEDCLRPFWQRLFDEFLTPHDSLVSGFVVKWPGPEGLLPPHAHFTYVAPTEGRSIVVWVSVDAIDPHTRNGPLQVLPRSHLVADEYFGSGTRPWYVDRPEEVKRALVTLPTSPGDVVIMDGRLVHGSDPNETALPRTAMLSEAVPAGLDLFHPVAVEDDIVELRPVHRRVLADAAPGHVASIFAYYHAPEIARSGTPPPEPLVGEPAPSRRQPVSHHIDEVLLAELCPNDLDDPVYANPSGFAPAQPPHGPSSDPRSESEAAGGGNRGLRHLLRNAVFRLQRPDHA